MAHAEPPFTMGIEEEYLLVDKETLNVASEPPEAMLRECEELCGGQVSPEFLRAQIEVGTKVCRNITEARNDLGRLRGAIAQVAAAHGLAPIAASTHPFAVWQAQKRTPKERYEALESAMQASARRLLICGMHVHVGLDDDNLRIDLMNQFVYFLPHLLALSASSPFWEGEKTGLQSYRLTVFDGLPRTRLPERFDSFAEYQRHLEVLIGAGILEDASKIWWDLRPSARYPTLEMRVTDVCTRMDDTLAVAALTVCLMRMLWRLRRSNQRWRTYSNMLVQENRWRAMRYGCDEGLIDFGISRILPYAELLEELISLVREDAEALGCVAEVESTRDILARGNSAKRQMDVFDKALHEGASRQEALRAVVGFLIAETVAGL